MALEIWWISGSPYAWWVLLAAEVKGLRVGFETHVDRAMRRTRSMTEAA